MRILIKKEDDKKMYHHTGTSRFTGCQCFKDCTCAEDFIPETYSYYTVYRRIGTNKQKKTIHKTLEEANERWEFISKVSST